MGAVLHAVVPPILFGMKPDMMLTMMFLGIMLFPEKKNVLLVSLVTGIISGLTTSFPGGLFPNIIDKPITAFVFFGLFLALKKFRNNMVSVGVLTAVGTVVSGLVFLSAASVIAGLPGPFAALFAGVVLPATVVNTIAMIVLYPIAYAIVKRTKLNQQVISG